MGNYQDNLIYTIFHRLLVTMKFNFIRSIIVKANLLTYILSIFDEIYGISKSGLWFCMIIFIIPFTGYRPIFKVGVGDGSLRYGAQVFGIAQEVRQVKAESHGQQSPIFSSRT